MKHLIMSIILVLSFVGCENQIVSEMPQEVEKIQNIQNDGWEVIDTREINSTLLANWYRVRYGGRLSFADSAKIIITISELNKEYSEYPINNVMHSSWQLDGHGTYGRDNLTDLRLPATIEFVRDITTDKGFLSEFSYTIVPEDLDHINVTVTTLIKK